MFRIGIIGCGKIAQVRHIPEYAENPYAELAGFYDLNTQRAAELAAQYGGKAYEQDLGMRIDYQFLAPSLADRLKSVAVDKSLRMAEKPSDHTPLITEFDL